MYSTAHTVVLLTTHAGWGGGGGALPMSVTRGKCRLKWAGGGGGNDLYLQAKLTVESEGC